MNPDYTLKLATESQWCLGLSVLGLRLCKGFGFRLCAKTLPSSPIPEAYKQVLTLKTFEIESRTLKLQTLIPVITRNLNHLKVSSALS